MSEEQGKDSPSEMSVSVEQRERSDSEVSSSESVKSDQSKGDVPLFNKETPTKSEKPGLHVSFSDETPSQAKSERSGSPVSSSVSMKSDHSKGDGPNFSEKTPSSKSEQSGSDVVSSVSVKSDHSKGDGPNFSEKKTSTKSVRSGSHVSSSVSVKSDHSKGDGPNFSEKKTSSSKSVRSGSHVSSSVSVKSDHSKGDGPNFSEKKTSSSKRVQFEKSESNYKNYSNRKNFRENLLWIFKDLEKKIIVFLKNELEKFKKILNRENTQYFVQDFTEKMRDIKEAALDMTLFFLRDMEQVEAADTLQDELVLIHQRPLKSNLKKKHQSVSEGIAKQGGSKLLKNIYTDLYMTLSVSKQVNIQNEAGQVQAADRRHESQEIPVECKNLFEAPDQENEIRTVLTKGVAGIGKSVSVQKFIVDWADSKENEDVTFIFPLAFREMNLKEKETQSLTSLIRKFFPEIKGLNLARNDKFKLLFILDGLDECRLPLNFEGNETCRDVSSQVSLDVLLTNLIKGNLLPSALIWITTRPAAAIKIPPECINRVTEVQGFNDAQKEEYFRKRFTDADLADEIIDYVKQSKSLFIMCYIPVFCWISATVLQSILEEKRNNVLKNSQADDASKILQESNTEDIPKTLTQMYTHFLRFQILQSRRKYDGEYTPDVSWDKDAILSLGRLAFHQLQRNNLLFYDTDLESCGIDASQASVYSSMCTQMFKEEKGIILGTTFCFVHLSIQEFIAALYAHLFLDLNKKSVFDHHESTEQENKNETMIDLLKTAVDKALESETGHLDLFLRFLLGLSLQTNRPLLRGLLTQQDGNDENYKEIVQYIKQKLEDKKMSPERSINLFYCLNELNDQTLVNEIQTQLREGSLSSGDLSPAQWSAVAFVLLTSEEEMEEFDLQKFKKSDECLFRLLEVLKISKRALLNDCDLTDESCSNVAKALGSDNNLIELNMSNNNLLDSGVTQLCIGLETCKLEILKLSKCDLTVKSCSALASVLHSDSSSLKDLDLSNNNLQDSGVKLLSDGLKENRKLEKLRLSDCSITEEGYKALASALRSNPSHLIELDLTGNDPGQSGVKQLIDLRHDPNCQLKTLLRFLGPAAYEACQYVAGIVDENPLLLRELNLSEHKLDLKRLAPLLQDKHCKLNILVLNNSYITDEDCCVLAKALNSNPSNLKKLDLTGTKLRDTGMKIFSTLFENKRCKLEKLKLSDCSITEEGYLALASALRSNPSHLIELDLIGNDPGQSGVKQLLDLLKEPDCKLKLRFLSPAADEACQFVTGIVGKNPLLLRELNLSLHELGDTRVNQISALLQDKHCKLNTLMLNNNSITAEDCAALTSAFNSNPSNLIELDLSGNKLGNSGIKKISPLLKNTQCRLEKLKLSDCSITEEGYKALASALRSNPSHLIELDLTGNDPGQSGVKQLNDLLLDRHYKLQIVRFLKSPAAEEACEYLTKALGTSPLLLKELDLSEDKLGDLDGKKLSALLMDSHSKVQKIKLNNCELTEKSCSVLATVLSSKTILKEMNLNNSRLLDSGVKEICEGLKNPVCELKMLKLSKCDLTEESCSALASVLSSDSSSLKDLDLSNNNLEDSGVKLLSDGLKENCKLEKLSLSDCSISEEGYIALASALRSNPSHLIELDLRGNDPGQSGVKQLSDLLQDPNSQLKTLLRFLGPAADEACQYVTGIVGKNPLLLRELNLSEHKYLKNVKQLAALLKDKHCRLSIIQLNNNSFTEEGCAALTSAFNSNPSNLKELDLSGNKLGETGVNNICCLLQNPQCRLEKLKLSDCSITEESYKTLTSALASNSHLIELDLRGNDPGQSGVKVIMDFLQSGWFKLKNISFLRNSAAEEACKYLTEALGENPLLMQEMDLSRLKLGDLEWEKISALLVDSHCKVKKIKLNNIKLKKKSCLVLATVLSKNNTLKEMDLSKSLLLDSGVKEICEGLKKPECKLKILKLSDCSITEEGYLALASALRSNPSHLIELDLTGNDPGQSGVEQLIKVKQNRSCKLETLRFLQSPADEACRYVTRIVCKNPLLVRELNLSGHNLDLKKLNLLTALLQDKHCNLNRLQLCDCGLTEESCSALATVLRSNPSLKELDMSNNNLQDSGVKKLQKGLENAHCTLEKLRLLDCSITEEGYKALASALRSNPSHLIELDLRGNDPGPSGVKQLNDLLQDKNYKLKTLRFLGPGADEACQYAMKVQGKNPLLLRELNLSENKLGDTRVNQIAALLQDKHCKLNIIHLCKCSITEKQCLILTSALNSNPSHLRELDLSGNKLGDGGVENLGVLLSNLQCKLEKLKLSECEITDEGCSDVTSALKSNPSHLRELNLSENKLGDSGVKNLSDLLMNPQCKLKNLELSDCSITEEGYKALASALRSNPSHLIELDLTGNDPGPSGVKQLNDLRHDPICQLKTLLRFLGPAAYEACQYVAGIVDENPLILRELNLSKHKLDLKRLAPLLQDKHCKLNILVFNCICITKEGCAALTAAFNSNPSNLMELDLSENPLGDPGVTEISTLLGNSQCTLKILRMSNCSITEEGYKALASALRSNPSHLIELDLTGNDPGQSGVKQLLYSLKDPECKLKLRFLSPAADEACQYVTGIVGKNPLLLRELNLSERELGDTRVNQIAALLQDNATPLLENTQCRLKKLELSDCSITEEGYKALASALRSNPSHLIELDLRGNDPGQSGVKQLNDLLLDPNYQLKTLRFLGPDADEACQYVTGIVGKNPLLLRELSLSKHELGDTRVNQIAALLQDKHCTLNTLMLNNNNITAEGCAALTSAFNSNPSNLKELDLSGNKLRNTGIKKICHLLNNPQFRLEKLRLSDCSITGESYETLTSALRSNSYLIELDLTGNDPGQSGVKQILDFLKNEQYTLKIIRFLKSPAAEEVCDYLTKVLGKNPLLLTELDLSRIELGVLGGEKLSALLMDSHSKVEKIKLNNCELTEKSCSVLATVLSSKTILKEMNLNNSRLLDSGVKEICEGLKKSKLKILKLSDCSITEDGYTALASALRSNPSHLIELDLRGNDPGQSGVKQLSDLQERWLYSLKSTLRFLGPAAEEACQYVTGIVGKNPLLLRELNLSEHELGDTRVNQISALLQDKHCKLDTIQLSDCSITEEGYKALASALRSNPSHLIELDLTGNDPGQSGVKELSDLLQDPNYQLKTLRFLSPAAEEACQYLTTLLKTNPLLLRELNLSECKLGNSNMKQITALLEDKHYTLNTLILNNNSITEEGCVALTSAINLNPSNLIELDLSGNKIGNSGIEKICPLLTNKQCRLKKLRLKGWDVKHKGCSALMSALNLNPSHLRELNLSKNKLGDSGVKTLSDLLKNTQCKLEKLQLSNCSITEEGYKSLASALRSNPSHLIELDLTGNDPGQSGVKQLSDLLQDPNCQLKTLRFLSPAADEACQYVTGIVGKNLLLLRELNLSGCKLGDSKMNRLVPLLQDKHCKLSTLHLRKCGLTEESCSALATVLRSNSSLKELDMSNNNLQDSGVKKLELEDKNCKLENLRLSDCSITEEGYIALASALRSNPSHLIELDLTGNDPGQSGVKQLSDLLQSRSSISRFLGPAADEACQYVTGIVGKNPLLLRELNLSEQKLGDTRVNQISALLQDKHCTLNTLTLCNCGLTEESCSALATVLRSNPSLKELDMSNNNLQDSGVKKLQNRLEDTNCTLEKLRLSDCSITEEGYKALASALRSNPSHLIELDLTGNDPGQSGVKELSHLLQDPNCQLKTLRFLGPAADEACQYVKGIVGKNPLLLRELNLSEHELGDTRVNQISALLQDKHCTLNTLMLNNNSITEKGCAALTSAFNSNPSNLIELDLSGNKLENSGMKMICRLLKNPQCRLEKLRLSDCSITEEGYKAVASALRSNPSHLIELDLTGNDPGQSGVKQLNDLLQDPNCQLKTLR
ncbi:uncharacterized protein [Sinocyclocheilus grahami]|uniref:uncharacterized protein n=1 Tax=Sinocyclocheilus grahami TaxID=75366 RepID=UPI0007ACB128|nr:PREDICTED: uncharacterized protein LOC107563976 [Sinocyclocheilus grahami]